MPLPLILGIVAGVAAVGGAGAGISGGVKMKQANDTMKSAQDIQNRAVERMKDTDGKATKKMDDLGEKEFKVLASFEEFKKTLDKVKNTEDLKKIELEGVDIPPYNDDEISKISFNAIAALGSAGAVAGSMGGAAAAGAATVCGVMALGTASTGTAIASLSGVAATNATLAALGGGAIAAGGGGMALGTTILGASTLGVGLLVGGIIFNVTGGKLSDKADEAMKQAKETKEQSDKICNYLNQLMSAADSLSHSITVMNNYYESHLQYFTHTVNTLGKTDFRHFDPYERKNLENLVLLVRVLRKACGTQLVLKTDDKNGINKVNFDAVKEVEKDRDKVAEQISQKAA